LATILAGFACEQGNFLKITTLGNDLIG